MYIFDRLRPHKSSVMRKASTCMDAILCFDAKMTAQIYFDSFIIYFHVQFTKFHEQ